MIRRAAAVTKSIDNDMATVFIDAMRQRADPQINQQVSIVLCKRNNSTEKRDK